MDEWAGDVRDTSSGGELRQCVASLRNGDRCRAVIVAELAAESAEQLQAWLLDSGRAREVGPVRHTVECSSCGERSRVKAPVGCDPATAAPQFDPAPLVVPADPRPARHPHHTGGLRHRSIREQPAADVKRGRGDVVGFVGGEERDHVRDIFGLLDPADAGSTRLPAASPIPRAHARARRPARRSGPTSPCRRCLRRRS